MNGDLMQAKTLCRARRRNGEPCRNPPMAGAAVCRMHGGAAPQVRRRAQQRLDESSEVAVLQILRIMNDAATAPAVRLAAAKEVLDRAGVVGKAELQVDVKVQTWEDVAREILIDVDEPGDGGIVDAEVVEDPTPLPATDEAVEAKERTRVKRARMVRRRKA